MWSLLEGSSFVFSTQIYVRQFLNVFHFFWQPNTRAPSNKTKITAITQKGSAIHATLCKECFSKPTFWENQQRWKSRIVYARCDGFKSSSSSFRCCSLDRYPNSDTRKQTPIVFLTTYPSSQVLRGTLAKYYQVHLRTTLTLPVDLYTRVRIVRQKLLFNVN